MARLIYGALMSVDGYTVDADGKFDWAAPDEDVHAFVNDLERGTGTYLYGRRMYETMRVWESEEMRVDQPQVIVDYSDIWRAAAKIVYSTTLTSPATANTRIENSFNADAVRALKAEAQQDLSIGGPTLAAHAIRAGLVDELHFFINPIVVGGGTKALPDDVRFSCELVNSQRFSGDVEYVHYRVSR